LARHWHFFCAAFWTLNGLIYALLLFTTNNWERLIPTSWEIIPHAWRTFLDYASFHLPPASEFHPYDPLQQLAYFSVIFIIAPLTILTGAAMSPAVLAHWPCYQRLFGNRQIARSIHFLLMVAYLSFFVIHVSLVVLTGFSENMNHIVLGGVSGGSDTAVAIGLGAIALVVILNVLANWWCCKAPLSVQNVLGAVTDRLMLLFFHKMTSRQEYSKEDISPHFWVNGLPPETAEFTQLAAGGTFADYRLQVRGLVENPLSLSMEDLKMLPKKSQITMHNCIQGWSGIAEWSGVPLSEILKACKPLPNARYLIFHSFMIDDKGRDYYGSLDIEEAGHPQTILAYEMNGQTLPLKYGAPVRLRVETKLGFKMVKYVKAIELVESYKTVGLGQGGYREDTQCFGTVAGI
ncbi:MAG: molybdopterin-dependent oxidoreductase, partial [Cyanobacteria bacterium SZAS TMP-1]|nr:molybdopterin-dependent oxidoreductase [Cyanobacteria bacterium SZAS TMP-1]